MTLGELCEIARGGSPRPIKEFQTDDPSGIPWIKISDATASSKYIYKTKEKIRPEGIKRSRLVKEGDFLLSNSMSFGRPYIMRTSGCIHDGWLVLSDKTSLFDQDYLYHFLSSANAYRQFDSLAAGSTVRNLNIDLVKGVKVPLPPLPEQKRIVAILDEAFAGVATAVANTEKNLANARELFDSYLNNVFIQKGEEWVETTLEKVLAVQPRNGWSPPAAQHSDSGMPVLTLSSVTGFIFKKHKVKFTSAPTDSRRHYWVKNGDFLITRSNTPELVGHVAIASGITRPTIYPDLIMRMNPAPDRMMAEFLFYQMRTSSLRTEITSRAQGANPTMKKISKSAVQTLPITMPSIATQKEIVARLNAIVAETQRLQSVYQHKLTNLAELKQSILHKAFSGELTAQPERVLQEAVA